MVSLPINNSVSVIRMGIFKMAIFLLFFKNTFSLKKDVFSFSSPTASALIPRISLLSQSLLPSFVLCSLVMLKCPKFGQWESCGL
jgi:hypothetical protein